MFTKSNGRYFKNGIFVFLLIIIFPILLNYSLQLSFFKSNIIGDEKLWLMFWSGYSGALIMSLITLFVLFKTLKQNQKNHENMTKFQIEAISTQAKMEWFNELKKLVVNNLSNLNFENINGLFHQIKILSSNVGLIKDISFMEEVIKKLKTEYKILYHNEFNFPQQKDYDILLDVIVTNYLETLLMIKNHLIESDENIEYFSRINEIGNVLDSKGRVSVEYLKDEHLKKGLEKKKKLNVLIDKYKDKFESVNKSFELISLELVKFEKERVFYGLKI